MSDRTWPCATLLSLLGLYDWRSGVVADVSEFQNRRRCCVFLLIIIAILRSGAPTLLHGGSTRSRVNNALNSSSNNNSSNSNNNSSSGISKALLVGVMLVLQLCMCSMGLALAKRSRWYRRNHNVSGQFYSSTSQPGTVGSVSRIGPFPTDLSCGGIIFGAPNLLTSVVSRVDDIVLCSFWRRVV